MEKSEDKKMIAEMNDFLADKAKAKSAGDAKAEENLPFESIDSYSTDPVGFGEMSLRMLNKVEFVFDLAVKENRFSPKYLKRCTQLEKGIKYLGSLCVTKYALQTKGQTFPQLGQLSTEKLYCMTSHHFRKLDMAVTEYMFEHRDVPDRLFDMEMRYFNLLERLRSTEVKIEKFHDRYIFGPEDYSPIIHGMAFSGKNKSRSIHEKHDEAPAFRHAPAFSPLASASGLNKKSEIRNKNLSSSNEEGSTQGRSSGSESIRRSLHLTESAIAAPCVAKPTHGTVTCDALLPENEEERMKKEERIEEQGPRIENEETSPSMLGLIPAAPSEDAENKNDVLVSGVSDQGSVNDEQDSDAELPPCLEIMKRVMERSREAADDSLTFTIGEMEFLAKDPLFARLDPRLAADIRKILEAGPPG